MLMVALFQTRTKRKIPKVYTGSLSDARESIAGAPTVVFITILSLAYSLSLGTSLHINPLLLGLSEPDTVSEQSKPHHLEIHTRTKPSILRTSHQVLISADSLSLLGFRSGNRSSGSSSISAAVPGCESPPSASLGIRGVPCLETKRAV